MKKIITFLILLLFPIITYAENVTVFSINEVTASAGNNVTINFKMDNKQEFGVLAARIHYDTSKLEYVSSEVKGLKAVLRGSDNNADKGLVILYAINLSGGNLMKDNGNVLITEFKIKDNVTDDIPLEIEIKDFGVDEETPLKYETKDGVIKIKKDVTSVKKDNTENLKDELDKATESSEKKEEDEVTWSTTDDKVATVDKDGNVTFNENGNVTIEAKDSEGNVLYSKDYYVNDKVKKKYPIVIIASVGVLAILVVLFILRRKKCKKGK